MYEIKLYKSKWRAAILIILSLPFIIIVIRDLMNGHKIQPIWLDWVALCFFGMGIPFGIFNLLDKRPQVIINEHGVFYKAYKDFAEWRYIKDVYYKSFKNYANEQKYICLVLDQSALPDIQKKFKNAIGFLGLADYNISLTEVQKIDEQKLITLIKAMVNANDDEKNRLLTEFKS